MSANQELAVGLFKSGLNCAQAVISVFCEKYGMDKETAHKIACGLGGGFRSGEVCGAASGAVLVVGLKYGQCKAEDAESKANCYAKTEEFLGKFREKNRSIVCREILGIDISTENGKKHAQEKALFRTICDDMVKSAVMILEDLGY
jgi:C_GCAxxG_C_C family probable redox protein